MNAPHYNLTLKLLIFLFLIVPYSAHADIYVDLSKVDEISIGIAEEGKNYTLKIEEPVAQNTDRALALDNHTNSGMAHLPYHHEVLLAAKETLLEPALIHAVIATESKHNARAKSSKGAYGLMQLMPATAKRFNVRDKNSSRQNILAGSKYLRELLTKFNGDLKLSLAAYNAGPAAVQKYQNKIPPYKETMRYVPKVLSYYRQYS